MFSSKPLCRVPSTSIWKTTHEQNNNSQTDEMTHSVYSSIENNYNPYNPFYTLISPIVFNMFLEQIWDKLCDLNIAYMTNTCRETSVHLNWMQILGKSLKKIKEIAVCQTSFVVDNLSLWPVGGSHAVQQAGNRSYLWHRPFQGRGSVDHQDHRAHCPHFHSQGLGSTPNLLNKKNRLLRLRLQHNGKCQVYRLTVIPQRHCSSSSSSVSSRLLFFQM